MFTVFRFCITGVLIYCLFLPQKLFQLIALVLFIIAVVTDFLDGHLARKYNIVSSFGKIADPIADKVLILGCFCTFAVLGLVSWTAVILIAFREILVTVLRFVLLAKGKIIAAESAGKIKVGFQVAALLFLWVTLWCKHYAIPAPFGTLLQVGTLLSVWGAVILTAYSGIMFLIGNHGALHEAGVSRFIGTFLYSGHLRPFPGTIGSIAAIPLCLILAFQHWAVYAVSMAVVFIIGVWSSRMYSSSLGVEDPSEIVIDEVLGMLITLFLIPLSWQTVLIGFLLFRVLDIAKPGPIHRVEKYGGGYGIMLDDILAGIFANLILRLILIWMPFA